MHFLGGYFLMQNDSCNFPTCQNRETSIDYIPLFQSELSSVVERHLAKVDVEGSNPLARSRFLWERSSVGRANDS